MRNFLFTASVVWALLIGAWSVKTVADVSTESGWTWLTTRPSIRSGLDKVWQRDFLIDLNGGFTKLMGRRMVRDKILRLPDDMMVELFARQDVEGMSEKVAAFAERVRETGRAFLFLHHPVKTDVGDEMKSGLGVDDRSDENDRVFAAALKARNVACFDLRPVVAERPCDIYLNFFRSDHHWNFFGAFAAARAVAPVLAKACGADSSRALAPLDPSSWDVREASPRFCGSFLRHAGRWFGTMDRLQYLVPRFKTHVTLSRPESPDVADCAGAFEDVLIDASKLSPPASPMRDSRYELYLGWEYPLQRIRHAEAPLKKRLLFVCESYSLPMCAFLATVFSEIDLIDLRHYEKPVLDYIRCERPDLVVVHYSPNFPDEKLWDFGVARDGKEADL